MIRNHYFLSTLALLALLTGACGNTPIDEAGSTTQPPSTSTTTAAPAVTSSTTTVKGTEDPEDSTSSSSSVETGSVDDENCAPEGPIGTGTLTGVFEYANLRAEPSVNSELITTIPLQAIFNYYPETIKTGGSRSWMMVMMDDGGPCGWLAGEFVKGEDGRVVGVVDAVTYIQRALVGLEPEAAHGTFTQIGPDSPREPFDDAELIPVLKQLRQLGQDNPGVQVRADETVEVDAGAPDGVGCVFVDGLICQVLITNGDTVIATAQVSWYGDGITGVEVQLS